MTSLLDDLRFSIRLLRRRPAASLVIVLTLALGIAVNATFFSSFYGMVLRPLPFDEPQRLMQVSQSNLEHGEYGFSVSPANFLDWRRHQSSFASLAAVRRQNFNLWNDVRAERISGAQVTADLFPMLGVAPALGTGFTDEHDVPGGLPVALISDQLWRRNFAADPKLIGQTIELDGVRYQVLGVMPPDFAFPLYQHLWTPLGLDPELEPGAGPTMEVIGRLRDGVSVAEAQESMTALAATQAERWPEVNKGLSAHVIRLRDAWLPPVTQFASLAMQLLAGLVLLIVCANVANMVLAQATGRRQEIALRAALGANRARLLRLALCESLCLSLLAGIVGGLAALWQGGWIERMSAVEIPYWLKMSFDPRSLLFTMALSLFTAVGIGLIPALRASAWSLENDLRSAGRSITARDGGMRKALVVAEYALAVIVLVGALLMVRSYAYLQQKDVGFAIDDVLTLEAALSGEVYQEPEQRVEFLQRAVEQLQALPGVSAAAVVDRLPISQKGLASARLEIDGQPREHGEEARVASQIVSREYFDALGIALHRGRLFEGGEMLKESDVVVINQSLADRSWPGEDPLGRRIRKTDGEWLRVVGVVADVQAGEPIANVPRQPSDRLYLPLAQGAGTPGNPSLVIRSSVPAANLATTVRGLLAKLDPTVPIYDVFTMETVLKRYYFAQHIWSRMFSLMASVALAIAAVGAYGVTAYSVSRRVRELAIRIALGADPGGLMARVVGGGVGVAVLGLSIGLAVALVLAQAMASLLHGIAPSDPWVIAGVVGLLLLVSVMASYFPARRASTVNPLDALREN